MPGSSTKNMLKRTFTFFFEGTCRRKQSQSHVVFRSTENGNKFGGEKGLLRGQKRSEKGQKSSRKTNTFLKSHHGSRCHLDRCLAC